MARMSGLGIPQISVVHGISVAGGAYMPAMSDVVIIVKVCQSNSFSSLSVVPLTNNPESRKNIFSWSTAC